MTSNTAPVVMQADFRAAAELGQTCGVPDITGPRQQQTIAEAFARHRTQDRTLLEEARRALKCAIGHIENMAAWIGNHQAGYSFEGLGEDMPGIRTALASITKPE